MADIIQLRDIYFRRCSFRIPEAPDLFLRKIPTQQENLTVRAHTQTTNRLVTFQFRLEIVSGDSYAGF